jgi:geranylgeranyl transferase type-2 subunit beta
MPDVFHTFFGMAGLSLLGHLHTTPTDATTGNYNVRLCREIDPVYALPTDVVERLALKDQVMTRKDNNGM